MLLNVHLESIFLWPPDGGGMSLKIATRPPQSSDNSNHRIDLVSISSINTAMRSE